MKPASCLTMSEAHHGLVASHLFPGDGLEAAAVLVCTRTPAPRTRLIVRNVVLVPHDACKSRERDWLSWPGTFIEKAIDLAEADDMSLVLIHSHPGGLFAFSDQDDNSDRATIPGIFQALASGPHGTAIMTANGAVLARIYREDMEATILDTVAVAGNDLRWWWSDGQFVQRPLAFTTDTGLELGRLCACVIGVSGTGSIVAEQLARLGFGLILLIDFDKLEDRNLNRILNSTLKGVASEQFKVDAFAEAITSYRGNGVGVPLAASITTREAVLLASQADVLFSCVDTLEARHYADLIAAAFLFPLFDVGVAIPTRTAAGQPVIADVCGRIDYVQPGKSTLRSRGVYGPASLRAEYLRRVDPETYGEEVRAGYIKGVAEQAPSVITLNMRAASACVMELIARMYPFRHESNARFARTEFSLAAADQDHHDEASFEKDESALLGRGDMEPLLGMPSLALPRKRVAP